MESARLFFNSNIKYLRQRAKLSQEELAIQLDLKRITLQALESGKTKNPSLNDLIKFAGYFKIAVDSLLKVDLHKLGELQAGNDVYLTGSQVRILAITVDKQNKENTEYIPIKAKAGYIAGYNDPEYIATLPKFSLPNLPQGTFRMFPTTGDSMLPIPENSDVIAQYVQDWTSIKPDTPCIVVLKGQQDFVFKMVTIQNDGYVLLTSLNKAYHPYIVKTEDVLELWSYHKHQTSTLPEPVSEIQELKMMISSIDRRLDNIK